jgi:predicted phosphodiesterase
MSGLLAEISLPKLIIAWVLLVGGPAVLIGIAPLALSIWIGTASSKAAYALSGIGSLLVFGAILAASWFGLRRLLRIVEESFWSLNSLAVQPAYVLTRELLRHVAEKLLPARVSGERREVLRARMAAVAGFVIFVPVAIVVALVWPATRWAGTLADLAPMRQLITTAATNSFVVMAGYFAIAALAWGVADAVMSPLRNLKPVSADPVRTWRIAHLSDLHTVGERYGFRIESGRAGARGNERLLRLFARLDAIHAAEPLDAVVVTGDITDAGRSAEWAEFFAALAPYPRLADSLLILPGNHDINVVDRANPARLDMPFSPNKRLREARIISAMAALQGSRLHLVDLARKSLGPTLDETVAPYRAALTAFADKGSLRLSRAVAELWTRLFPLVRPPQTKDGLGIILLNSNADTHFSFTNALGLVSADEMRGVDIACSLFPSARWLVGLHHHTSEYPRPVKQLSERIGTALINGTWFLRRLQQIAPGAIVMHGHRHIDWIGDCGSLRIVSAPSPVMNATDERTTYFYIHTLARTSKHPLLDLMPPERIDIPGSRLRDIDSLSATPQQV